MQAALEKLSAPHLGWSLTSSKAPKPGGSNQKPPNLQCHLPWHRMARPGISCAPEGNETSHLHIGSYAVIFQKQIWQEGCANVCVSYQHLFEKKTRSAKPTKVTWELIILCGFHKTSLYHRSQGYKIKHLTNHLTMVVDFNLLHWAASWVYISHFYNFLLKNSLFDFFHCFLHIQFSYPCSFCSAAWGCGNIH